MSDRPESAELEHDAPRLASALRALHPSPPPVPRSIDDAIQAAARAHLRPLVPTAPPATQGRIIFFPRLFPKLAMAVAAALMFGLGVTYLFRPSPRPGIAIAREDIDRNGRVDILDAFALARRLQSTAPSAESQGLDVNGDGIVDQRDVDAVAARAVKVTKG